MPESKNAAQRAKENFKWVHEYAELMRPGLPEESDPLPPFTRDDQSLGYATFRAGEASVALTLHDNEIDEGIAKAFAEANLDPENPWHWRALLHAFAEAHYPRRSSNQFWTSWRLTALLTEIRRLERISELSKKGRDKKLKDWIERRFPRKGKKFIAGPSLPRLLRHARDRKKNRLLDLAYQEIEQGGTETLAKHFGPERAATIMVNPSARATKTTAELAEALACMRLRWMGKLTERGKK